MNEVSANIKEQNYSMCLRDAVEVFTKELINCLFDTNYNSINGEATKNKFFKNLREIIY